MRPLFPLSKQDLIAEACFLRASAASAPEGVAADAVEEQAGFPLAPVAQA